MLFARVGVRKWIVGCGFGIDDKGEVAKGYSGSLKEGRWFNDSVGCLLDQRDDMVRT